MRQWHFDRGWYRATAEINGEDFDLVVCSEDPESVFRSRVERMAERMDVLMPRAVRHVIDTRCARLGWRDGPDLDDWAPVALGLEKDGCIWLSLHEYETDEYSLWLVRFAEDYLTPDQVRRAAWKPDRRPFSERGEEV